MNAARHLERCRIGAEPANGRLPHCSGGVLKIRSRSTSLMSHGHACELRLELARSPSGVTDDQASATAAVRAGAEASRATSTDTGLRRPDPARLIARRARSHQHPAVLLLDGTTDPHLKLAGRGVHAGRSRVTVTRPACQSGRLTHDRTRRPAVPAEQNDRTVEVRIPELRHRQQERGGQRMRRGSSSCFPSKPPDPETEPWRGCGFDARARATFRKSAINRLSSS